MPLAEQTLRPFFWRATKLFPEKAVVTRTEAGSQRYTYGEFGERVSALANALSELDVDKGTRVGTLAWNHHRHLEAYFTVPLMGAQLHTINTRLPDEHVEYIINDAADDILLVDPGGPLEKLKAVWDDVHSVDEVIVLGEEMPDTDIVRATPSEALIDEAPSTFSWPSLSGDQPAGMCYTSGTTGMPKGLEYTQQMMFAHAMMATTPVTFNIDETDVVMPVVPMFHVNGWELPYAVTMVGAKQVYPGPSPTTADIARMIEEEGVTLTAAVPTVWIDLLGYLEEHEVDVSSLDRIISGGSAVPKDVMDQYQRKYDVTIEHAWGMTETMSVGSLSRPKSYMDEWDDDEQFAVRQKQGLLSPGLEMRVIDEDGKEVPWNGNTFGELYVRGPTVIDSYYNRPKATEEDFATITDVGPDGDSSMTRWLKTGDVVTVDDHGYIEIVDRKSDVIKSGGEWISSIELENKFIEHDAVVEAAVIAVPDKQWQERPVAFVVEKPDSEVSADDLRAFVDEDFPRWWLPDNVVFTDEIPKTSTGKFDKKVLRDTNEGVDRPWSPGEKQ